MKNIRILTPPSYVGNCPIWPSPSLPPVAVGWLQYTVCVSLGPIIGAKLTSISGVTEVYFSESILRVTISDR